MYLNFKNNIFSVTLTSCNRIVGNVRQESERYARELYASNKKIMLGLSGGLDSQVVLHSFVSQQIPIECAFLYLKNCNDFEYENVKFLQKKYNIQLTVVELDPFDIKDEMLEEYKNTNIPPFQLMHKKFLSKLPLEYTFIQGLDGPDLFVKDKQWYIVQTANSFVNSRIRAMEMLNRPAPVIAWEKDPGIFLSIIDDGIMHGYRYSHINIFNNGLSYANDRPIPSIDHFDLYIKTIMYGKYWKNELEYFHKYQGPEKVDWIMEKKWHRYKENVVYIPFHDAIDILKNKQNVTKTYNQRN